MSDILDDLEIYDEAYEFVFITNWKPGNYFNVSDYVRIMKNIFWLKFYAELIYPNWDGTTLESVTNKTVPKASFFNKVVAATQELIKHTNVIGTEEMNTYEPNGKAWTAQELNIIENNHLLIHNHIFKQEKTLKRISFVLNGGDF